MVCTWTIVSLQGSSVSGPYDLYLDHCVIASFISVRTMWSVLGPLCHCRVHECQNHMVCTWTIVSLQGSPVSGPCGLYLDHCVIAGFIRVRTIWSVLGPLCHCRVHQCQNHMVCTWTIVSLQGSSVSEPYGLYLDHCVIAGFVSVRTIWSVLGPLCHCRVRQCQDHMVCTWAIVSLQGSSVSGPYGLYLDHCVIAGFVSVRAIWSVLGPLCHCRVRQCQDHMVCTWAIVSLQGSSVSGPYGLYLDHCVIAGFMSVRTIWSVLGPLCHCRVHQCQDRVVCTWTIVSLQGSSVSEPYGLYLDHCVIAGFISVRTIWSVLGPLCHCRVRQCQDHMVCTWTIVSLQGSSVSGPRGLYLGHCVIAGFVSVRTIWSVLGPLCHCRVHQCQDHMVCTWTIVSLQGSSVSGPYGLYLGHCVIAGFVSIRTIWSVLGPLCHCSVHQCQDHMVCTWTIVSLQGSSVSGPYGLYLGHCVIAGFVSVRTIWSVLGPLCHCRVRQCQDHMVCTWAIVSLQGSSVSGPYGLYLDHCVIAGFVSVRTV